MFSKKLFFAALVLFSFSAFSDYEDAEKQFGSGSISLGGYRKIILELVQDRYYFSVLPWFKDYLVKNNGGLDGDMENAFDTVLGNTGVKILESLPDQILRRSNASAIRYILGKRLAKQEKYMEALAEINRVSIGHYIYPFVANLKGAIHAAIGESDNAILDFKECIRISEDEESNTENLTVKEQLRTNRDICLAGISRVQFGRGDYKQAELTYLDVTKDSFVWPQILFEEAWTSYYLKNYNRTLGKLVSYKAPVFDFIFKPEIEVLNALTYLKMCLYDDAKKTVDQFYSDNLKESKDLKSFLLAKGKNYKLYYELVADIEAGKSLPLPMLERILHSVKKDSATLEIKGSITGAIYEYNRLRKNRQSSMKSNLMKNVQTLVDEYRSTLGSYVRSTLIAKYGELVSAFQGMSYIKLEVLAQRKDKLYQSSRPGGNKRGDVKYIQRNDKQYFWTFNGEFWADELGDYVFALGSEC